MTKCFIFSNNFLAASLSPLPLIFKTWKAYPYKHLLYLLKTIIMKLVIASQCYKSSPGRTEWEKDLYGCFFPNLKVKRKKIRIQKNYKRRDGFLSCIIPTWLCRRIYNAYAHDSVVYQWLINAFNAYTYMCACKHIHSLIKFQIRRTKSVSLRLSLDNSYPELSIKIINWFFKGF